MSGARFSTLFTSARLAKHAAKRSRPATRKDEFIGASLGNPGFRSSLPSTLVIAERQSTEPNALAERRLQIAQRDAEFRAWRADFRERQLALLQRRAAL